MQFWPVLIVKMVWLLRKDEMSHCLCFSTPPRSWPNKFLDSISKFWKHLKTLREKQTLRVSQRIKQISSVVWDVLIAVIWRENNSRLKDHARWILACFASAALQTIVCWHIDPFCRRQLPQQRRSSWGSVCTCFAFCKGCMRMALPYI